MKGATMRKLKFSELDSAEKRAVFWLADEAKTLTPTILAAVTSVGQIWEAKAFMKHFPKGSASHTTLADRLRLGGRNTESVLDCIRRAAPAYETLGARADAELDELLEPENASTGL
jgi:hypothetical protein